MLGRTDRYSAVNTNNRDTLEIRIFRGTINKNTVKAAVDLAHASVEYTRSLTVIDVRSGALDSSKFIKWVHEHADTYPDLLARINKLLLSSTTSDSE
jgi:hypothetical protein